MKGQRSVTETMPIASTGELALPAPTAVAGCGSSDVEVVGWLGVQKKHPANRWYLDIPSPITKTL